jgi:hypothetical protein
MREKWSSGQSPVCGTQTPPIRHRMEAFAFVCAKAAICDCPQSQISRSTGDLAD